MNTYEKYCPNVWVAKCSEKHEKRGNHHPHHQARQGKRVHRLEPHL